jgi:hypothetical protein
MGVFRPTVSLVDSGGRRWEVYAYRLKVPPPAEATGRGRIRSAVVRARGVSAAALRSLRSDEWTIEAITWLPGRTSYTWTTTREYRDHVLAQVEGQLARGDVPRPRHAVYLGGRSG